MLLHPLTALVALCSLGTFVIAIPSNIIGFNALRRRDTIRQCANELTTEEVIDKQNVFNARLAQNQASGIVAATSGEAEIQVVFNVIYAGEDLSQGNIPYVTSVLLSILFFLTSIIPSPSRDDQIKKQIDVLNQDYQDTGLSFVLQSTVRKLNADWFNNVAPRTVQQTRMKTSLRQGGAKTLNVYTVGFNNGEASRLLGYATFPSDYDSKPRDDGVVLRYSTLPGGSSTPFNLGKTLTHEVGHWVGLYHTFQGGCDSPGDEVDDTPYEASPSEGCEKGRDTCSAPGVDRKRTFATPI